MNYTNSEFDLMDIKESSRGILVIINIIADEITREIYVNNYFEGIYIDIEGEKYSVFSEIKNDKIVGEILFETIDKISLMNPKIQLRLWIRNRIGNNYIDNPVYVAVPNRELYFGRKRQFLFESRDGKNFSFSKKENDEWFKKPVLTKIVEHEINVQVYFDKKNIIVKAFFSNHIMRNFADGQLEKEVFLAWQEMRTKKICYLKVAEVETEQIEFVLALDEINQIDFIETNMSNVDWIIIDSHANKYKLYLADEIDMQALNLPLSNYYAELYCAEDRHLGMKMATALTYEYIGACYNGNGFLIREKRKSYYTKLEKVVARKVNTDFVYELPFEILEKDEKTITYGISLQFTTCMKDFKKGIYQLFVEIQDGIIVDTYPLKLFREKAINENTYLVAQYPYAIVGNYCYDCLIYNDSSNNMKINLLPKVVKLQMGKGRIEKEELKIAFKIKKEAHFEKLESVSLLCENEERLFFYPMQLSEEMYNLEEEISIPITTISRAAFNSIFTLEMKFTDIAAFIRVENNYYRPAINNRENASFSVLYDSPNERTIERIWGNQIDGGYKLGVTENIALFKEMGVWLYEEKILCVRLETNELRENIDETNIRLYARNKITGDEIEFERETAVSNEIIFKISLEGIACSEYILIARISERELSYLKMTSATNILYAGKLAKKVSIKRNKDAAVDICVDEMLLCESPKQITRCDEIIRKAREENKGKDRKVWLVGENYGLSARDNGLAFFEFCMSHDVDAEVYFVYKEKNEDTRYLETYKNNLIVYDSEAHIYLDELAEFYIVSHGIRDVMPSLYHDSIGKYRKNVIYLQHGIIAMKQVGISNKSYGGSIRKFVVSSRQERDLLANSQQFWEDEIIITGLPRYDKLFYSYAETEYIWIMPTWRDWLVNADENFKNSDFYNQYSQVLASEKLLNYLRKNNRKVVFSLHVEFEKYKGYFSKFENDVVHITDMHEKSISDRIMECQMMVTDYSSIIFDVVYMKKPAIFFQYDQEMYCENRGSYVNLNSDLPGTVVYDSNELVEKIIEAATLNFVVKEEDKMKANNYFDYYDCNNSYRVYEQIINCREEIADEN